MRKLEMLLLYFVQLTHAKVRSVETPTAPKFLSY